MEEDLNVFWILMVPVEEVVWGISQHRRSSPLVSIPLALAQNSKCSQIGKVPKFSIFLVAEKLYTHSHLSVCVSVCLYVSNISATYQQLQKQQQLQ